MLHGAEANPFHDEWLRTRPQDYSGVARTKFDAGAAVSPFDLKAATERRALLRAQFAGVMQGTPTTVVDFLLPLDRHGFTEECYFIFSYSPIRDESIRLGQFLKLANLVETGAEAKPVIADGLVRVNGEVESRRGRQLVLGDVVELAGQAARVSDESAPDNLPW